MTLPDADTTLDAFLGGRLRLRQLRGGHRAGHDAILLAAATAARAGDRVVELGAGIGAAGLALAARVPGIDLTLVEIDAALAALAEGNAIANGIAARVCVADVAARAATLAGCGLGPDSADVVLMNPPFNAAGRHRGSPDAARRLAHEADAGTLDIWVHTARRLLRSGGALTMIWRAADIADLLAAMQRGFGSIAILPVHPRPDAPAIRVLLRAVKGGRGATALCPGLVLNDTDGSPTAEADEILRGRRVLPLACV